MLAHYHAQVWNGSELARSFGISQTSVRRYLDILTDTLVIKQLQPWHENLSKRQVKAPKIYLDDAGLLHNLLGIETLQNLTMHPKVGASWEGFIIQIIIRQLNARPEQCYFWASYSGAEIDLLIVRGQEKWAFEIKRTTTPKTTKSMHESIQSLGLDRLYLIHAGEKDFMLAENIQALSLSGSFKHFLNFQPSP